MTTPVRGSPRSRSVARGPDLQRSRDEAGEASAHLSPLVIVENLESIAATRWLPAAPFGLLPQTLECGGAVVFRAREPLNSYPGSPNPEVAEAPAASPSRESEADSRRAGADRGDDTQNCVQELRGRGVTRHVSQNTSRRRSAIDRRTTRHAGYAVSQRIRKRVEEISGWMKTIGGFRRSQQPTTDPSEISTARSSPRFNSRTSSSPRTWMKWVAATISARLGEVSLTSWRLRK